MRSRAATFGDICEFKYGKSLSADNRSEGNITVYGSNGPVGAHDIALSEGPTIIIGRKGSVGEVHYCHGPNWPIDTTYYIDRAATNCDLKWLAYALRSSRIRELNKAAAVPGLNRNDAYRQPILVPPPDEQKRIAAILDKADQLRQKRREAIALLAGLTQSIFTEMFGDPKIGGMKWPSMLLHQVVEEFRYGTSEKSQPDGHPVLRIPNVIGDSISAEDLKYVPLNEKEFERLSLRYGDILFVRTNGNKEYVGRSAVVTEKLERMSGHAASEFVYASYLIRARLKSNLINPHFLQTFLSGSSGRKMLLERSKTSAGQYNINTAGLGDIRVPVPPLEQQRNFQERLGLVLERAEIYSMQSKVLGTLFQSLQHRAFSGQL
ncbi:restriction endonuclease subunit S [Labrys neptuniae]